MPRKPLTAAQLARLERLLDEYGIDAADPERLERLVLALDGGRPQQAKLPRRKAGKPYEPVADWVILRLVGKHLARQKERGVARPSIRRAAIDLAKRLPFNVRGMSAETIRKRHAAMLRRVRSGEGLHPEILSITEFLGDDFR